MPLPQPVAPLFPKVKEPIDPLTIALAELLADLVADEILAREGVEAPSEDTCE